MSITKGMSQGLKNEITMKREEITYQTNTGEFVAEKLLPCPFCGGEPEFVTIGNDYTKSRKAEIKCTKCFCKRTTGAIHNNLEWCGRRAIELWNKRTAEQPLPPAEGAKKVQWSGYGELGNISQKPLQPTAEGAEEILKKIECKEHIGGYWLYYEENVIDAMAEFATLHAQRLAGKMVEERLREELIMFDKWSTLELYSATPELLSCEETVDEYLSNYRTK